MIDDLKYPEINISISWERFALSIKLSTFMWKIFYFPVFLVHVERKLNLNFHNFRQKISVNLLISINVHITFKSSILKTYKSPMEMWCWSGWRGVSTNNASLSFGRTSAGIVSCFFWGLCDTICELFVWMYILTKLSLLSTNVWANLSYLFYFGEVKVDTFFGTKKSQWKVLSEIIQFW